jgi:hypothetical protein
MGLGSWEYFQDPLMRHHVRLSISFGGIGLLSMEKCALSIFLGSWVLVAPYLCSRFCIFHRLFLEEYIFKLKGAHTCFNHIYVQREMAFLM